MAGIYNTAYETLFDPSSPSGSTASANSYLSFSALADFRNPQDSTTGLEKWQTGSHKLNMDMDEAAFSDLLFSNPSPFTYSSSGQTDTGMSPWALSPESFGSAEATIPNLPLPQASCSTLGGFNDVLFPEIDLLDAVDPHDCSQTYTPIPVVNRNPSLVNKASNESMMSSASGTSDFLLTPRHSMHPMPHGWDDLAVLPMSSGSSVGYVERIKDSRSGSSSSAWSGGISLDMEANNYVDMNQRQGTFPIAVQQFNALPMGDGFGLAAPSVMGFTGQNLDWAIEQHSDTATMEKKEYSGNGQLLPPACIVGNVPGWQASSPTYPSLIEFDNASVPDNLISFRTEPLLSVTTPSRPARPASTGPVSSVGQASGAMLGAPMMRKSRSSHGTDNRKTSSLFAFHPVDHSSGPANLAVAGPSTYQAPAAYLQPQQYLTPPAPSGLSTRRSIGGLSIQTSMLTGSEVYPSPYDTSSSTVSNMLPPSINTAPLMALPPYDPSFYPVAGPMSAPLYQSYDAMTPMTPVRPLPSPVAAPASVLQPAPGNINVAPPLSADLPPPAVVEAPRPRSSHKHIDVQPVLTSTPLAMPSARPDAPAPATRVIAALPSKRKVSAPKPRKPSGKKSSGGSQPFCSFINFTAKDAAVISAGVAPSGSKNKRRSEDSPSPEESGNKRSRYSDSP